jgi:hypothetical protein
MTWFYEAPIALAMPLFVVAFLLVSWAILLTVRPWVQRSAADGRKSDSKEWDRVLGYSISSYGLFYGILLALVAVSVYENYSRVHEVVLHETSALGTLYRDISGFPEPLSGRLQDLLHSYTERVITVDWPLQRQGIIPDIGTTEVSSFQKLLFDYQPPTGGAQALYNQAVNGFNDFVEARRARVNEATLALPYVLWILLWVGAALNALMLSLVDVARLRIHMVMAGIIAVFVAMLIFVTASLDHPYAGPVSIGPDYFQSLLDQLMTPTGLR